MPGQLNDARDLVVGGAFSCEVWQSKGVIVGDGERAVLGLVRADDVAQAVHE
jgi:hypothetical protein